MYGAELVERTDNFLAFVCKGADGFLVIRFVQRGMDRPLDEMYAHVSSGRSQSTLYYEISNGVCTTGWMNPAMLRSSGLLGEIAGYGVNAFLNEKGTLKTIKRFIREYGKPARRVGCLGRLLGRRGVRI